MKKLLSFIVLVCLTTSLIGCSNKIEYPFDDALNSKLEELGITDVKDISVNLYQEGDEEAKIDITTEKEKIIAFAYSYDDEWDFSRIVNEDLKTYYASSIYANEFDIYSYKTGEIISYKKDKQETPSEDLDKSNEDASTNVSKSLQFIKNGYKDFDGNYRKDITVNGSTMYKYFFFDSNVENNYFDVSDDNGDSTVYYYNSGWGGQHSCKFDYKNNSAKEGSLCNDNEIENIKYVKDIFEQELETIGLTIDDLNK